MVWRRGPGGRRWTPRTTISGLSATATWRRRRRCSTTTSWSALPRWLAEQHPEVRGFADLTTEVVRVYRAELAVSCRKDGRPLQPGSVFDAHAIGTFPRWARSEGYEVEPRLLELKRPKVPKKEPTLFHISKLPSRTCDGTRERAPGTRPEAPPARLTRDRPSADASRSRDARKPMDHPVGPEKKLLEMHARRVTSGPWRHKYAAGHASSHADKDSREDVGEEVRAEVEARVRDDEGQQSNRGAARRALDGDADRKSGSGRAMAGGETRRSRRGCRPGAVPYAACSRPAGTDCLLSDEVGEPASSAESDQASHRRGASTRAGQGEGGCDCQPEGGAVGRP